MKDNIENVPTKYDIPADLKKITSSYPLVDSKIVPVQLTTVPDLLSGGKRKRKFGLALSIAVVPDLDKEEDPLMLGSQLPTMFFDADTLDDLLERAQAEMEAVINAAREQLKNESKSENTEELEDVHQGGH